MDLPKIILASASPRRAEILRTAGWQFETLAVHIDETRHQDEEAVSYVKRLAREKAETAAGRSTGLTVVGADTTVVVEEQILEKPIDSDDAERMLRLLSGRWHKVLTGVAVVDRKNPTRVDCQATEVKFAAMNDDDISWYVASEEPMDKAGAYAIQGLGARFIEGIRGDYFNVVGLPIRLVYELLQSAQTDGE